MMRQRRGDRLQDDEQPLLLALVRFGKKSLVTDMIEKRGLFDKTRTIERLAMARRSRSYARPWK